MKKEHKISLSYDDTLCLPKRLTQRNIDGKHIIISPETANWIVLEDDELMCFSLIKNNAHIYEILNQLDKTNQQCFKKTVSKILSRKFAGINTQPVINFQKDNNAYFSITNRCNLQCAHCYVASGKRMNREISTRQWIKIAEEFTLDGGTAVTLTGGELLMKSGWLDILKKNHALGLQQTILTNGTLWTEAKIEQAAQYVDEVQVSLDGVNEHSNAPVRGHGNFERALATIKSFDRLGIRTSVAMTPLPSTVSEFASGFMEFVSQHIHGTNIKLRLSQKILPLRNGDTLTRQMQDAYKNKMAKLSELLYPKADDLFFALAHRPNEGTDNCGLGGITIDPCGFVHPCNRLAELSQIHNCTSKKLSEISCYLSEWASLFSVDNIEGCKTCDIRYICGGGCRLDEHFITHEGRPISFKLAYKSSILVHRKKACGDRAKNALLRRMINMSEFIYG